jgi:uncharacterized membrane protein YdjX (TVP38/TMEM64 family)
MEKNLTHQKRSVGKVLTITIIIALVLAYFFIPTFNSKVNGIFMLFSYMSIESIAVYIRSFGIYAVLVSFLLMVFQSVAAPLPAFLITFANAAIFGWWQGALLSWISSMAGAALCFGIARVLGRDAVEKLTSKYAMASVEGFFEKYGKHTILVCRLLPFVSFDFVSYAAGLTSTGFLTFIVATGIGQLPATVVYSYVGGMLTGGAQMIVTTLLILFAITVLIFMFKQIYKERQKKSEK